MADFLEDSLTGSGALTSHTGETGASWTYHASFPSSSITLDGSGGVYATDAGVNIAYASGTPASADYSVIIPFDVLSHISDTYVGAIGRLNTSTGDFYWADYHQASGAWRLSKFISGQTILDSQTETLATGSYELKLHMVGTTISLYARESGGSWVLKCQQTDSSLSAAGKAGMIIGGAVMGTSTGYHITNITGGPDGALVAGALSYDNLTTTAIDISWDDATGGTGPYTYQLYRSRQSGTAVGAGSLVSGATSSPYSDTGLTPRVTYFYKVRVTDDVGGTADSGELEVTTLTPLIGQIVCDGNSLTADNGTPGVTIYPAQLATLMGSGWDIVNLGVSGQTTQDMIDDADTEVDVLYDAVTYDHNILVAWEIGNDIHFGATANEAYNSFVSYCQARQAAGFKVVAVTVPARSGGSSTPVETFDADRLTANDLIRANWRTFADALADVALDTRIDTIADCDNSTYYYDETHFNTTGYSIIAEAVKTAILEIVTSSTAPTTGGGVSRSRLVNAGGI